MALETITIFKAIFFFIFFFGKIHNHTRTQGGNHMKYNVILKSGRSFILNSGYDVYEAAYDAYEEACLSDDYLVDVVPINE